jgi:ABC-type multidrug transport system permease subunit
MLAGQSRYALREFWRTPVSAFFTLVFPLSFLVILSAMYGNEVVDPDTGLRLAQYTTPVFAVFGTCMACYMSLGIAVAYARSSGVLKRLRGTPLPPGLHIAGRVCAAVLVSALAVAIMVGVGVVFYDVQIITENVPALVLTFLVGAACFSALGLAVASVAPTPNAASAFANASLILLSFISGIFGFGQLPEWMDRVASVFPLKPFVDAFSDGFNPYIDASTPDWGALGVMILWGIAGAVIVSRSFSWEPRSGKLVMRGRRRGAVEEEVDEADLEVAGSPRGGSARGSAARAAAGGGTTLPAVDRITVTGSPGVLAIVGQQTGYAMTQIRRDPMSLFFSVLVPVLLVTFFSSVYGEEATWGGLPLPQYLAAAFSVYGVATSGLVNVPGSIAEHRTQRTLKRLRGTPMPPWSYIVGRILAVVVFGLLTVVLVFTVAVLFFSVTLPPSTWAATLLAFTLTICCFAACGLALVALVDSPQAVIAMSLSILLPLSFISDIFIQIDEMPTVLNAIGWFFPLRHAVHAAVTATSGAALDVDFWVNLGVIVLWMAATGLAAWRFFRWEPRQARSSR